MSLLWITAVRIEMVPVQDMHNWESSEYDAPLSGVMSQMEDNWHRRATDPHYDHQWTHIEDIRHGGPRNYIDHLKAQIAQHGIDEPLEVHQYHPDLTPSLHEGHHRYVAATELGMSHLPVRWVR